MPQISQGLIYTLETHCVSVCPSAGALASLDGAVVQVLLGKLLKVDTVDKL